jgi:Fe2+ transport system protein FeoA
MPIGWKKEVHPMPKTKNTRLNTLKVGQEARIDRVKSNCSCSRRLQEMGVIKGATIRVVRYAPLGDPMEIELRGYRLALRKDSAEGIEVTPI